MKTKWRVWGVIVSLIMLFTMGVECGGGTPTINPNLPVVKLTPFMPGLGTPGTLGTLTTLDIPHLLGTPVGFEVEEYAPFCHDSYAPLCEDPDIPVADSPCTPGVKSGNAGAVTLAGIGCPTNKQVRFDFDSNGGGNTGFNVTVNGDVFTCTPSPTKPDVFTCIGPEQPMGKDAVIIVCSEGTLPTPTPVPASTSAESGITLASYLKSDLFSAGNSPALGGGGACPDGFIWLPDPEKLGGGECVRKIEEDCPENWFINALGTCATDREDSCPAGTVYDKRDGGCVPTGAECPPGWVLNENKVCVPKKNDHQLCPRGYYYDRKARCCLPVKSDNFGCDEYSYFDFTNKVCLPIDGNGCGVNQVYDKLGRCVGLTGEDGKILPEDKPAPGKVMRSGDLLVPGNLVIDDPKNNDPDCGADATFFAAINNCVKRDENGCPYGYHFDQKLQYCIPDDGPGSTCPLGYRYNERLGCCVPLPGFNGARCPEDEKLAADLAAGDLTFANTLYDPGEGLCVPAAARDKATPTPVPGAGKTECSQTEYFDKELGYCVPLSQDCCPQGYGLSCILNKCMPFYQDLEIHFNEGECDEGYELVKSWCVLTGCPQEGAACATIIKNVPECVGGCEVGYTMINGVCVKREEPKPDPCKNISCKGLSIEQCKANQCCEWIDYTGYGICQNK